MLLHVGADLGVVIGRNGSTIIRLQKDSECVMSYDNKKKTVRIIGATPEITRKGETMVRDAIEKALSKPKPGGGGRGGGNYPLQQGGGGGGGGDEEWDHDDQAFASAGAFVIRRRS